MILTFLPTQTSEEEQAEAERRAKELQELLAADEDKVKKKSEQDKEKVCGGIYYVEHSMRMTSWYAIDAFLTLFSGSTQGCVWI